MQITKTLYFDFIEMRNKNMVNSENGDKSQCMFVGQQN